jgi:hypothetical protein
MTNGIGNIEILLFFTNGTSPWLCTVMLLLHQPQVHDNAIRHKNANTRKITSKLPVVVDADRIAKTTPTTKQHTSMIPSIGPRMYTEREADGCPVYIDMDC